MLDSITNLIRLMRIFKYIAYIAYRMKICMWLKVAGHIFHQK